MGDAKSAFADDCFGRKEFADNLLKLIKNQKDYESRVIAIKADFGLGKTFFAEELEKLMIEHLSNSQDLSEIYPHYINIWKDDYTNEPLLALLYALENITNEHNKIKKFIIKFVKCCAFISLSFAKVVVKVIFKFTPCNFLFNDFFIFIDEAKRNLKAIKENNKFDNVKTYKNITDNISKAFERHKDKKFVIIIDEIDRCMPEYAIRFLETLKHFFDIQGLYFILMLNEKHLQKSIKKQFCYIDFTLWKDKFIDLEFDLSVFHNQENFIKYLVEQKYKFGSNNTDNMQMYITYKVIGKQDIIRDTENLFGTNWTSYINKFLNSLNTKLNNRQLNMLCFRLSLALDIMSYETIMPDCLMCVILKDMFKDKKPDKKDGYNKIAFTYYDGSDRKHILNLFCGGKGVVSSTTRLVFFNGSKGFNRSDENRIETQENKGNYFDINKKAAEFAILTDKTKKHSAK